MSDVKAGDVKALRDRTGAGMMDCKKALVECNSNIEDSIDWLRKNGLAAAAKKAGRVATEGLVGINIEGRHGAIVEINAETDFVARNELFQKYVETVAKIACQNHECDMEKLGALPYPETGRNVSEELTNLIAIIGENMGIRRVAYARVTEGVVASYIHNKIAPNLGRIGIFVELESSGNRDKLLDLGKRIAMHIAAANPQSTSIDDLDQALLKRERDVVTEQAKKTGKPAEFVNKIVEGRIRKFYEEVVLLEQVFVVDGTSKVKDVVAKAEEEIGCPIVLKRFVKFVLGEGIEKQMVDFAAEVTAQLA
ncbi:MAG: translation elongation factor Ts [Holosporaceae bacterium]|jgi:elongation factor Ts|nr:translation elongation factor Ts [Holosporaceae bacterium]